MLRLASLSLTFALLLTLAVTARAAKDYFTEDELDLIRDAQELQIRVPLYFKLAERRLITLGVMERSDKEKEKEQKEHEKYEKDKKKAGAQTGAVKPPADDLEYLKDFTHAELLRGYIQALDEVMSNIDDSYSRKLDVRESLESLEKFTRETRPLLEKYEPKSAAEKSALQDALDKAKEANDGAKDAMKTVPKTEKKPAQKKPGSRLF